MDRGDRRHVTGEPIMVSIKTEADFEKYSGKLKGKVVLSSPPKELAMQTKASGHRLTDEELAEEVTAPEPGRPPFGFRRPGDGPPPASPEEARKRREERRKFQEKLAQFMKDEGVLVLLSYGYNGDGGTVFATRRLVHDPKKPIPPPSVALTPEHYNRIARLLDAQDPGQAGIRNPEQVLSTDHGFVQRDRRNSRQREEGRDRDAGRAPGFLARRHRRHRQRRRVARW